MSVPGNVGRLPDSTRTFVLGVAGIALAAVVVYFPSLQGGFLLDDDILLTGSPIVVGSGGLARIWFSTEPVDYWPLTNTSFWIEWRLWGMNPTGYHVTNLALHVADCLLLWLILKRLAIPGAWLAALLFAIHPVNVESVAWISQRKNVLSMLFFLLSVLSYLNSVGRALWYWLSLAAFILAMLSKGSVAVLPPILLLLTWWQRGRITKQDVIRMLPFFAVAIVLAVVNVWFQTHGSAEALREATPVERLLGAAGVVWFYLYQALLPLDLLFVYPQWTVDPRELRWWAALIAAASVTALFIWKRNTRWGRPLLFAWLFFCLALAPVMGFVDVGFVKYSLVANRYLHIAVIAVVALAGAGMAILLRRSEPSIRAAAVVTAAAVLVAAGALSWQQSRLHADPVDLYENTLARNPAAWQLQENLGVELFRRGRTQQAIEQVQRALRLQPDSPGTHYNLANMLREPHELGQAIEHYRRSIELRPDYAAAHNNLGIALVLAGRLTDGTAEFQAAIRLEPDFVDAHKGLAHVLADSGRISEALAHFQEVVRLMPDSAEAHDELAKVFTDAGRPQEALTEFEKSVRFAPNNAEYRNSLGTALFRAGRVLEAISQYRAAVDLDRDHLYAWSNLSLAYAHSGQLAEAVAAAERALGLARSQGRTELAGQIEARLRTYEAAVGAEHDSQQRQP